MKRISILFVVLSVALCSLGDTITHTLTFTNGTVPGDAITVIGNIRTFTNDISSAPGSLIFTNSANGSATNYFKHVGAVSYGDGIISRFSSSNVVKLIGDGTLTVSLTGTFATLTSITQASSPRFTFQGPIAALAPANRTNQASEDVLSWLYSTNSAAPGIVALLNYAPKTNAPLFNATNTGGVDINVTVTNSPGGHFSNAWVITIRVDAGSLSNVSLLNILGASGILGDLTNGSLYNTRLTNFTGRGTGVYLSNATIHTLLVTNFSSPGPGSQSFQVGADAIATGDGSVAVGNTSTNDSLLGTAVGALAQVIGSTLGASFGSAARVLSSANGSAFGTGAVVTNSSSGTAVGGSARVMDATGGSAFGARSTNNGHRFSTTIGYQSGNTDSNQVRLGRAVDHVSIPGDLRVEGSYTNAFLTGSHRISGTLALTARAASLGSGDMSAVNVGTNALLRFTLSGAATNSSFVMTHADDFKRVQVINPGGSFVLLHKSNLGTPPETDKIDTGTGSGFIRMTNNPAVFEMHHDGSYWVIGYRSN
jgi:hypothetical protein